MSEDVNRYLTKEELDTGLEFKEQLLSFLVLENYIARMGLDAIIQGFRGLLKEVDGDTKRKRLKLTIEFVVPDLSKSGVERLKKNFRKNRPVMVMV